jgi:hypothetical protein
MVKEKIRTVMAKHYRANSKALDLSRLHTAPYLVENCAVPLFLPSIMTIVLDITMENVPYLRVLDLSNNNLSALDSLIVLALRFPKLRILHIGRNLTRHMDQLDCLEGLLLEELVLQGNPPFGKYQVKDSYVSKVKKRFPGLRKLDGADLTPHQESPNEVLPTAPDGHVNPWPVIAVSLTIDENHNIYENSDVGSVRMGGPGMKRANVDDTSPPKRHPRCDILQSS